MMPASKLRLITFSTPSFWQSVRLLSLSARRFGVDEVRGYSPKDLEGTEFWIKNKAILELPRGRGYWSWKSYLVLEELKNMGPDEVLLYSDAGIEIVGPLQPLVDIALAQAVPVVVSDFLRLNGEWTKRDCFVRMNADRQEFYTGVQVVGGFNLFRNTRETRDFVADWMKYAVDDHCNTDEPSRLGEPELPQFKSTRHDQSILSILVQQYGLPIYRDPSVYASKWMDYEGDMTKDPDWRGTSVMAPSPYGIIMDVHRLRNKKPAHILEMLKRSLKHRLNR